MVHTGRNLREKTISAGGPPAALPDKQLLLAQYHRGYAAGYEQGVQEGIRTFGDGYIGTSIIIPTYNCKDLLLQCLERIDAHTPEPYEIIVVDNGSSDGTEEEIRRRGNVRLAVHPENLGFARAINTGLMMARGRTLVLLNNDVLVTERWLEQLMECLRRIPDAAAVGPVTNYISGEQQITVPYEDVAEMPAFAAAHNRSDPGKWRMTSRLVGFCVAFPRATLLDIGYFDEGYEIGNYEDDDWTARLRLQGKKMVIAGDTFVHHFGSMTMKGLGAHGFAEVNTRNHNFFQKKWGDLQAWYIRFPSLRAGRPLRSADFFPTHVRIKGGSDTVYWLEHGVRYPLHGAAGPDGGGHPPIRLSVLDLLQLVEGPARSPENLPSPAELRLENGLPDGSVVRSNDGILYQIDRGRRREFISDYTRAAWGLAAPDVPTPPELLYTYPEGLPILPPTRLINGDL